MEMGCEVIRITYKKALTQSKKVHKSTAWNLPSYSSIGVRFHNSFLEEGYLLKEF